PTGAKGSPRRGLGPGVFPRARATAVDRSCRVVVSGPPDRPRVAVPAAPGLWLEDCPALVGEDAGDDGDAVRVAEPLDRPIDRVGGPAGLGRVVWHRADDHRADPAHQDRPTAHRAWLEGRVESAA